jgi:LPXTG-motif cell wall-anchored protein
MRGSGKSRPGASFYELAALLLATAFLSLLLAAPASADPANEEYNLDIPEATESGSDDGDTVPEGDPAPPPATEEDAAPVDLDDPSGDADASGGAAAAGGAGSDDGSGSGGTGSTGESKADGPSGHPSDRGAGGRAHSLPAIAADGAGNSGVWLLLLGLALVLALAVFLIYRRRRPRQLEV